MPHNSGTSAAQNCISSYAVDNYGKQSLRLLLVLCTGASVALHQTDLRADEEIPFVETEIHQLVEQAGLDDSSRMSHEPVTHGHGGLEDPTVAEIFEVTSPGLRDILNGR